jgi:syntaxin-binding protein 1
VYIGSTHVITPEQFVKDLSLLDKKCPPAKSVVPPYTGSIHTSKTNSTQGVTPPRTTSSNPPSKSGGGHKILGKW